MKNHLNDAVRYGTAFAEIGERVKKAQFMIFQIREICEIEGIELEASQRLDDCETKLGEFLREAHEELTEIEEKEEENENE